MASLTVTWTLPALRSDGATLPVAEIKTSEVSLSSDKGVTWTLLANVPPGQTQTLNKDLPAGEYKIRILEIDTANQRGVPAIGDALILPAPPAAPVITSIKVA